MKLLFFWFLVVVSLSVPANQLCIINNSDISITYFAGYCYSTTIGQGQSCYTPNVLCGNGELVTIWQATGGANWGKEWCNMGMLYFSKNPIVEFSGSNGNYNCTCQSGC